jgi:hypothetical protein
VGFEGSVGTGAWEPLLQVRPDSIRVRLLQERLEGACRPSLLRRGRQRRGCELRGVQGNRNVRVADFGVFPDLFKFSLFIFPLLIFSFPFFCSFLFQGDLP